jgi:hypothetical protein
MFKTILMPAMIGAAVAMTGIAYADSMKDTHPNVYKEAQPSADAAVRDKSVNPDARLEKKLYKESQPKADGVMDNKKVSPDTDINKRLYKESQKSALPKKSK